MKEIEAPVEGTQFGSGWISGVISATLGVMGFLAVLCLRYPALLTSPHLREIYPMPLIRGLIHVSLIVAFGLGALSLILRRNKTLGAVGTGFAIVAALLGGADVQVEGPVAKSSYIGLDWFLLDMFLLALIFVPMERMFARLRQNIFRPGWKTDLVHFLMSHIGVQLLMLLTMVPASVLFRWTLHSRFQQAVGAQPAILQFFEALVLADLAGYGIHRLFHAVPFLWRFHAIHHSSQAMDWLAGSRLHLVDIIVTRAFAFIPLYAMGFSTTPLYFYLVFVSFHAVFIHANVRFRFGWLDRIFGTPRFHHWHHSAEREAIDKNFAIHLPAIDWLFGTHYLPKDRWPAVYGIAGNPVPEGYTRQLIFPLR